ncbi:MAG TPA: cytochrome B6 [Gemmataceae bacterium]|nr:cytochrome B6 [Gemmataceae bacterium]
MSAQRSKFGLVLAALAVALLALSGTFAGDRREENVKEAARFGSPSVPAAAPVKESLADLVARLEAAKPGIMKRQRDLLNQRYDLRDLPAQDVTMSGGKPVQEGVRVRLSEGMSWEELATLQPEEIRERGLFPIGFLPLPHVYQPGGGMVLPGFVIHAIKKEGRDLTRFDVEFDLPEMFLPEFPPPMYLTTRPDLGNVTQGKLVTLENFYEIFDGILNPKQLDGLRLLLTPLSSQQYNPTDERRTKIASRGVACFDCHANGHTVAAFALSGDIRPQSHRIRIDTPSLRGVNMQRLFGSKRALKSVEDITEFEQRTAYFDGDPAQAAKKGLAILERGTQVQAMAEFQQILGFPPAPKLDLFGKLDRQKATESELNGQRLFFGKAKCGLCHPAPYYTDGLMHDLKTERFFKPQMVNHRMASVDGLIKTFPLRGIKDSPPYLHDGRLLTLEDTVEFFNLVLELHLDKQEKADLVAFMRQL